MREFYVELAEFLNQPLSRPLWIPGRNHIYRTSRDKTGFETTVVLSISKEDNSLLLYKEPQILKVTKFNISDPDCFKKIEEHTEKIYGKKQL